MGHGSAPWDRWASLHLHFTQDFVHHGNFVPNSTLDDFLAYFVGHAPVTMHTDGFMHLGRLSSPDLK